MFLGLFGVMGFRPGKSLGSRTSENFGATIFCCYCCCCVFPEVPQVKMSQPRRLFLKRAITLIVFSITLILVSFINLTFIVFSVSYKDVHLFGFWVGHFLVSGYKFFFRRVRKFPIWDLGNFAH